MSHDNCVGVWTEALELAGWDVHAVLDGYSDPPIIQGKKPDIYAWTRDLEIVVEVETDESIDTAPTREQVALFKEWASGSRTRTFRLLLAHSRGCIMIEQPQ